MRIILCDDRREERCYFFKKLQRLADDLDFFIEIQSYESGKQLLFESEDPDWAADIVYLAVEMAELSGLKTAGILRRRGFSGEIVFLARSDAHWQTAFDLRGYHYLLKHSCSEKKFASVFYSVVRYSQKTGRGCLVFSSRGETVAVPIREIRYFAVEDRMITAYYQDGSFAFYSSMKELESALRPRGFIRVHRSYLAAISQIVGVTSATVLLKENISLPLGRQFREDLFELLLARPSLRVSRTCTYCR